MRVVAAVRAAATSKRGGSRTRAARCSRTAVGTAAAAEFVCRFGACMIMVVGGGGALRIGGSVLRRAISMDALSSRMWLAVSSASACNSRSTSRSLAAMVFVLLLLQQLLAPPVAGAGDVARRGASASWPLPPAGGAEAAAARSPLLLHAAAIVAASVVVLLSSDHRPPQLLLLSVTSAAAASASRMLLRFSCGVGAARTVPYAPVRSRTMEAGESGMACASIERRRNSIPADDC